MRADVDIPERKFKMTMSFRRNTDTSLPASHTAELTFILPQNFDGGGVGNVPGILMKSNEQARGTPLAGLAVKVTDGFFLVGLSNVDSRPLPQPAAPEGALRGSTYRWSTPTSAARIIAIEKGAPGAGNACAVSGRDARATLTCVRRTGWEVQRSVRLRLQVPQGRVASGAARKKKAAIAAASFFLSLIRY